MKHDWSRYKDELMKAKNDVHIFDRAEDDGSQKYSTVMEMVVNNISYITVNKYLRILGTSDSAYESVFGFTKLFKEIYHEDKYIIAHDVFGGLFATERTVQYFAPDTLAWEDLQMNYEQFIKWAVKGKIDKFYQPFLWNGADEVLSKVSPDEGVFVYPFFWAKECDINTATKKIVPFREILDINYQNCMLLDQNS